MISTSTLALTVVIHLANLAGAPAPIVRDAQAEVVEMLHDIDVDVEWTPIPAPHAILLTLLREPVGAFAGRDAPVLGVATRTTLGTGTAWVFYRRVEEEAERYLVPAVRVLACAKVDGESRPLIWTHEHGQGRIFASVPGHYTRTLNDPLFRVLLLRGIAWAAGDDSARFEILAVEN